MIPTPMPNQGFVADALLERGSPKVSRPGCFWIPIGDHFRLKVEKTVSKKLLKIDAEKVEKLDAKRLQNDAKIDAKINGFSYFSEKDENAPDPLFSNIF